MERMTRSGIIRKPGGLDKEQSTGYLQRRLAHFLHTIRANSSTPDRRLLPSKGCLRCLGNDPDPNTLAFDPKLEQRKMLLAASCIPRYVK